MDALTFIIALAIFGVLAAVVAHRDVDPPNPDPIEDIVDPDD